MSIPSESGKCGTDAGIGGTQVRLRLMCGAVATRRVRSIGDEHVSRSCIGQAACMHGKLRRWLPPPPSAKHNNTSTGFASRPRLAEAVVGAEVDKGVTGSYI